jgi:3-oxoadipate enol-lactonase
MLPEAGAGLCYAVSRGEGAMSDPTETGLLPVSGGELYYERRGQGPPLVLIHSGFLDHRMWDPQFENYATHYTVIRYDVRGHGRSSRADAPYSDVQDLQALLDHLGVRSTFLIGSSNGARIAAGFAAGALDRVGALVLVSGAPGDLDPTAEEEQSFMDTLPQREEKIAALAAGGQRAEAVDLMLATWSPAVDDETRNFLRGVAADNLDAMTALIHGKLPNRKPSYPVTSTLRESATPILVVVGERDHPALRMLLGRFAQSVPSANFVTLKGADHTANLSDRKEFNRVVQNFLDVAALPRPPPVSSAPSVG